MDSAAFLFSVASPTKYIYRIDTENYVYNARSTVCCVLSRLFPTANSLCMEQFILKKVHAALGFLFVFCMLKIARLIQMLRVL
jgi:hypothetical protein